MIFQAVLWLCCIAFFLIAELDRVQSDEIVKEGEQLRKHYQGSISMAACSQPSDMQNIWEEIGDKVRKVDNAINVLISAGLSSPTLRFAAERGVNIDGAGHAEVAIPAVFLGPQLIVGFSQVVIILCQDQVTAVTWPSIMLEAIAVFARLIFMFILYRAPIDERRFMLKVITKLVATVFFPTVLSVAVLVGFHCEEAAEAMSIATFMCFNCSLVLALFFACLGIKGTMCLPGGKCILQLILQRGFQCRRAPAPSKIASNTDSEESEDSE